MFLLLCLSTLLLQTNGQACKHSSGGFHLIPNPSTDISSKTGTAACSAHGWYYADITSSTWEFAAWTVGNCTTESVGIASYNKYTDSDCQYMQASGVFAIGVQGVNCTLAGKLPLLCSEQPTEEAVFTGARDTIDNAEVVKKEQYDNDDYSVCPYTDSNLRLINGPYMQSEAEEACAAHSWSLADINTTARFSGLAKMWAACDPLDATAWVSTKSSAEGGKCQFIYYQGPDSIWLMISEGEHPCTLPSANVLCVE